MVTASRAWQGFPFNFTKARMQVTRANGPSAVNNVVRRPFWWKEPEMALEKEQHCCKTPTNARRSTEVVCKPSPSKRVRRRLMFDDEDDSPTRPSTFHSLLEEVFKESRKRCLDRYNFDPVLGQSVKKASERDDSCQSWRSKVGGHQQTFVNRSSLTNYNWRWWIFGNSETLILAPRRCYKVASQSSWRNKQQDVSMGRKDRVLGLDFLRRACSSSARSVKPPHGKPHWSTFVCRAQWAEGNPFLSFWLSRNLKGKQPQG